MGNRAQNVNIYLFLCSLVFYCTWIWLNGRFWVKSNVFLWLKFIVLLLVGFGFLFHVVRQLHLLLDFHYSFLHPVLLENLLGLVQVALGIVVLVN